MRELKFLLKASRTKSKRFEVISTSRSENPKGKEQRQKKRKSKPEKTNQSRPQSRITPCLDRKKKTRNKCKKEVGPRKEEENKYNPTNNDSEKV